MQIRRRESQADNLATSSLPRTDSRPASSHSLCPARGPACGTSPGQERLSLATDPNAFLHGDPRCSSPRAGGELAVLHGRIRPCWDSTSSRSSSQAVRYLPSFLTPNGRVGTNQELGSCLLRRKQEFRCATEAAITKKLQKLFYFLKCWQISAVVWGIKTVSHTALLVCHRMAADLILKGI